MIETILGLACNVLMICADDGCGEIDFLDGPYIVCSYRSETIAVGLFQQDDQGKPFGSLFRLSQKLPTSPAMLMNGGMYHEDLSPVGLYVEDGHQTKRLSKKGGWGNFHLLPNGVFWGKDGELHVSETKKFARLKTKPEFATQSGPMLVINGKVHPRFIKDSDSLKIRNGVGISKDGKWVHFAISKRSVNFWDFGKLFQKELDAYNALFLDGSVSSLRSPDFKIGGWRQIGPIIGVFDNSN